MPHDAVIVLANLMDSRGNLNPETRARVDRAARVIKEGGARVMVTCGWAYRDDCDICIAEAMRGYAVNERGIAASDIVAEISPRDTVGDAVFTKVHLAIPRHWSSVLVATSAYHLPRALDIFSFIYGPSIEVSGIGAESADSHDLRASEARSLAAFRLTFQGVSPGDDSAIIERLRTQHPYYNGAAHPRLPHDEWPT
jgi:hypothetical protein